MPSNLIHSSNSDHSTDIPIFQISQSFQYQGKKGNHGQSYGLHKYYGQK